MSAHSARLRKTFLTKTKGFSRNGSFRYLQRRIPIGRRHLHTCTENRLPRSEQQIIINIVAFDPKMRMFTQPHPKIKMPRPGTATAGLALLRQTYPLTLTNPRWNFYLIRLNSSCLISPLHRYLPSRTVNRLLQGHHDIGLKIPTLTRPPFAKSPMNRPAKRSSPSCSPRTKKTFEKIAQSGPFKIKIKILSRSTATLPTPLLLPAFRRPEIAVVLHPAPERIVFPPLLRILQNLVSFVDFLKLFLRSLRPAADIGMIFARKLPISLFDFLLRRSAGNV